MYEEYWGLTEKPFENTPNTKFLYRSREHKEAISRFMYAIREKKGLAMFTGEYGSGKTLIVMTVLNELKNKKEFQLALVINPRLTIIEFLREIIFHLQGQLPAQKDKLELLHILRNILNKNSLTNRETVVIIDEAQMIQDVEIFEELRLLSNIQYEDKFLLTLIFVGQPQLKEMMERIPQLKQRLAITDHLLPLGETETAEYINYRLGVAGSANHLFSNTAVKLIYQASLGVPRKINTICDICLVVGKGEGVKSINETIVQNVIGDILKD
jgi:general secretion pathway protein A